MNHEEAIKLSFSVPWKTENCPQGEDCWCRGIAPVTPILFKFSENASEYEELSVVDFAVLSSEYAEYFVQLHNKNLR